MEQNLKNTWLQSTQMDQININYNLLLQEIKQGAELINKRIKARDFRESAAALVGLPIFLYFFFEIPYPLTKFACLLALAYFVFVIYMLRKVRKGEPKHLFDLDLRNHLKAQKVYLKKQQKLIHNAVYWYLLPPFVMNLIFICGIGNPEEYGWEGWLMEMLPHSGREQFFFMLAVSVLYAYIAWMNRKAARVNFQPTLDQITDMESELENA